MLLMVPQTANELYPLTVEPTNRPPHGECQRRLTPSRAVGAAWPRQQIGFGIQYKPPQGI